MKRIFIVSASILLGCCSCHRAQRLLAVHVAADGRITVDARQYALKEFEAFMKAQSSPPNLAAVTFLVAPTARHADFRRVMDCCSSAGFWNFFTALEGETAPVPYHTLFAMSHDPDFDSLFPNGPDPMNINTAVWLKVHLLPIRSQDRAVLEVDGNRLSQESIGPVLIGLAGTSRTNVFVWCNRESRHGDLVALLRECKKKHLHTLVLSE